MTAASKSRPEEDVLYLRKSRADIEMESQGEIDILARHEAQLLTNARRLGRSITQIYREVVSGDTIAERPLMQQLLQEVEEGRWAAVHVVEVERLARGDTMDQGLIERVFRYSDTKIITPLKTYDPLNIFDRQYLQFGLFMSRFEYETIKRRMQNGRIASVNEGKWPANIAPYGYRRVKLEKQKGWTLEIVPEEADVVKSIYRWYTSGELGVSLIVRRLNDAGFISPRGKDWTNSLVRDILSNVAYAGWVRWGNRPAIKKIKNGDITISRPRSSQALIGKGLHPAIVTQEVFDMAQTRLSENPSRPGPKQMKMKNPLSGLIYCSQCGRAMVRRPNPNCDDMIICPYTSCHNVGSSLYAVEQAVLESLRSWLTNMELIGIPDTAAEDENLKDLLHSIEIAEKELSTLKNQELKIYDFLEQGIYTKDVFLERSKINAQARADAELKLSKINEDFSAAEKVRDVRKEIIPRIKYILDAYGQDASPTDKNKLLKSVLLKVEYTKTRRERQNGGSDMKLILYPKYSY